MQYSSTQRLGALERLVRLYAATMRFMRRQVAEALLDSGLSCSLAGEKLRAACRIMAALATAAEWLVQC